jgi:hypothetical protein
VVVLTSMRPRAITITTVLMAVLNFFEYAALWDVQSQPATVVIFVFVATTVVIAIGYVVLWNYYNGWKWARVAVILASLVFLLNNCWAIGHVNPILKVVDIAQIILAVFLLVWLNLSTTRVYFTRTKRQPSRSRTVM